MAFGTAIQPALSLSDRTQDLYPHCNFPPYLDAMNCSTSSNEFLEIEGSGSPSSRSNTRTTGVDSTFPTSNAVDINSLHPMNATYYDSTAEYNPFRQLSSPRGFNTSTSLNLNAPGIAIEDYTNTQNLYCDLFNEPEAIDLFYKSSGVVEFNQLNSVWHPLNSSLNTTSSEQNSSSTGFGPWAALAIPWSATNAEWSAREISNPQDQYEGTVMDRNKSDPQPPSQDTQEQAKDDSTFRCLEIGCGTSFSRTADLRRHYREMHDPRRKRYFCGCCDTKPHDFKRKDKLKSHKVTFHKYARGSELKKCSECSKENALDVFYFCSDDALRRHQELAHGIHPVENISTGHSESKSETFNEKRMQSLLDENSLDSVFPVPVLERTKRERQSGKESTAKRAKIDFDVPKNNGQRTENGSNECLGQGSHDLTSPITLGNGNSNSAAEEILVLDVGISDFYALSENKVIRAIEEDIKLNSASGPAEPEISFNAFQGSIRLRGFGNVTAALQSMVYNLLGKRERLGSSLKNLTSLNLLCMKAKLNRAPQPQYTGIKIFPMRQTEDGELLKVWHEKIIPSLPDLLAKTIGGNCSASLIRKGISEISGTAVIQIQTHTLPSKAVRSLIRNKIVHWVNKDISLRGNQVQFLKGRLTTLAGELHRIHDIGDSPEQSDQVGEDNDESECYPFYKRYWRTPGPGASIGLLCTRSIAATICCYVHVEGRLFILTVKHFITKSNDHLLAGITDRTTVVSPALADVDDMREKFTQFVTDFKIELDEAMKDHFGDEYPEYVSHGDIGSLPDHVQDIMAKLDIVRKDLSHLTGGDRPFRLGSLAYQSNSPSNSGTPLLSHPGQKYGHHMDWAVCSVDLQRAGTNRHRYKYDEEEQAVDFFSGDTDTFGAGQPFLETCVIEPNTKVHFVGQATGRQSGEINAALILVLHDGIVSQEWAMVTAASEQDGNDMIHKGDSGASVIRDCDNKLAGIIWARTGDGQLVLTPINIVFDDIREKVPAINVSLPQTDQDLPPDIPLSTAVHEVDTICRDKTIERPRLRRQFRSTDMPSPRRKEVLPPSGQELISPPRSQPPITKSATLPIVLPNSQLPPIFNPPRTTFRPVLPLPECFQLAQQMCRTLEDNKNKHSIGFLLSGYSNRKLERRPTFPQTQDKVLHRAGTWPGKYHFRFGSQIAETLNAISVS